MRRISAAAAIGIAALSLTACGGAPDDASKDDFCDAWSKFSEAEGWDDTQKAAEKLEEVGTPKEIKDDAREGFEILIDIANSEDNEDDASDAYDDLDSDDTKKVEAFSEKTIDLCMDLEG